MANYLLRQGRVIDPHAGLDEVCDVLVRGGRIDSVGENLSAPDAEVVDCRGKLVLPGLIDTHAHVYQYVTGRFGLNPDMCGVQSGVTTLIDQGGPSCMTLPGFRQFIVQPSQSRVVAFLSAYLVGGMEGHYYASLYRPDCIDVDATVKTAQANPDLVKGLKAHAELGGFERWGVESMRLAAEIGRQANLPVYIHFGRMWPKPEDGGQAVNPDTILDQVMDLLKPGDVLAHPFSRHPGGFVDSRGRIHPLLQAALERGMKLDVGHGSHFSFRVARQVLDAGFLPDSLGADMHGYNTTVPAPAGTPAEHPDEDHMFLGHTRFSLVSAMTSMLALGVPLNHVVAMATINAARMARMEDEIGTLAPGRTADVTVLSDERGRWVLRDNEDNQVVTDRMLQPLFCLRAGVRIDADAPILPAAAAA
ncbi:amidohydrolase/deacetylase family metallohydrolase [Pigmentiphaga soli]|uniref:Amidohydrolase/deacetylase family metallohydrolase n=1 Tax=Pigmentiphaga soli TaxID=1007095 RepID=A0ABP8HJ70_9BURK